MKLEHLAWTVIEVLEWEGAYHWILVRAVREADRMQEHSSSTQSFPAGVR